MSVKRSENLDLNEELCKYGLSKLGPPTPKLAPCGAAWATEGKWRRWTFDGSASAELEFIAPVAPSVSVESITGPEGLISSGVYLSGMCANEHYHRYVLRDGAWAVEK